MKIEYSATSSNVKLAKLNQKLLLAIGRLLRACAEIEDILTLYLCELAQIREGQFVILLGRTPVSKKVKLAEEFAEAHGGQEISKFKRCFGNEHFKGIFQLRNAVAHGLLLGKTDEGKIAFRVVDTVGWEGPKISVLVHSYAPEDIVKVAVMAEEAIPNIEEILMLQSLREERRARPLDPHRKSRSARKGAKTVRQPPPSEA